jgi:dolichol-phosphate mannosyltransferase
MLENANVLVITPAFNEWDNLVELCPRVIQQLSQLSPESKWLIVSEAAVTNRAKYDYLQSFGNIEILPRHSGDESFASALQIGINSIAEHDFIVIMDGDQSHQPEQIVKLITILCQQNQIDIVISSRYIDGGTSDNSLILKVMSRTLNFVFRKFLGLDAKDISTNFKAFRAHLLRDTQLVSTNFEAVEELLIHASLNLARSPNIIEIPDHFTNRIHGESKRKLGQFIGSYLLSLFILKYKIRSQREKT